MPDVRNQFVYESNGSTCFFSIVLCGIIGTLSRLFDARRLHSHLLPSSDPSHPPQSSVRNEVMATSHVTDEWMTLMEMSSLNCYIVRRYIATPSGVLRIYPGSLMDKAFDPTRRQW